MELIAREDQELMVHEGPAMENPFPCRCGTLANEKQVSAEGYAGTVLWRDEEEVVEGKAQPVMASDLKARRSNWKTAAWLTNYYGPAHETDVDHVAGVHNLPKSILALSIAMSLFTPTLWAKELPMHIEKKMERSPSGQPKSEYSFYLGKDGKEVLHGTYITWFESGRKFSEQDYRDGKAEGRTTYWHENGQKSAEGMYHQGQPIGTWISWHQNGQKETSCDYVNGEKEGRCLWWDDQGKPVDAVEYVHGKPRAIVEWEARDNRVTKTAVYLYPYIVILPTGNLTFTSNYAGITKEFSLSQMEEVFAALPESVWVDGKSIGIQQIGLATEEDHRTMDQVSEKVSAFFTKKGYRVQRLPQ